jgi:hypothetical protein
MHRAGIVSIFPLKLMQKAIFGIYSRRRDVLV